MKLVYRIRRGRFYGTCHLSVHNSIECIITACHPPFDRLFPTNDLKNRLEVSQNVLSFFGSPGTYDIGLSHAEYLIVVSEQLYLVC